MNRRGFTLVELIVAGSIIGVLAALAVPRLSRGEGGAGNAATQMDWNLLQRQMDMYSDEHMGTFPAFAADGTNAAHTSQALRAQLFYHSDIGGKASKNATAPYIYGPYLAHEIPKLKTGQHAGENLVYVVTGATRPAPDISRPFGWM